MELMRQQDFDRWVIELNAQEHPQHNLNTFAYLMQHGVYVGAWYKTQDIFFTRFNEIMNNN